MRWVRRFRCGWLLLLASAFLNGCVQLGAGAPTCTDGRSEGAELQEQEDMELALVQASGVLRSPLGARAAPEAGAGDRAEAQATGLSKAEAGLQAWRRRQQEAAEEKAMAVLEVQRAKADGESFLKAVAANKAGIPSRDAADAWASSPQPTLVALNSGSANHTMRLASLVKGEFVAAQNAMADANESWRGWRTKVRVVEAWLRHRNPDELVVYLDGTDILWGGCPVEQFLQDYGRIVMESGAVLVAGAELAFWEGEPQWSAESYPAVPAWAETLYGIGKEGDRAGKNLLERQEHPNQGRRFLNAGFIVGPARAMQEAFAYVQSFDDPTKPSSEEKTFRGDLDNEGRGPYQADQGAFHKYFYKMLASSRVPRMTLDYGSRLVLNLAGMEGEPSSFLQPRYGGKPCFIHGNGPGKELMNQIQKELA